MTSESSEFTQEYLRARADPCFPFAVVHTRPAGDHRGRTPAHDKSVLHCAFCRLATGVLSRNNAYRPHFGSVLLVLAAPDGRDASDERVLVAPVCPGHWGAALRHPRFVAVFAWALVAGQTPADAAIQAVDAERRWQTGITC